MIAGFAKYDADRIEEGIALKHWFRPFVRYLLLVSATLWIVTLVYGDTLLQVFKASVYGYTLVWLFFDLFLNVMRGLEWNYISDWEKGTDRTSKWDLWFTDWRVQFSAKVAVVIIGVVIYWI